MVELLMYRLWIHIAFAFIAAAPWLACQTPPPMQQSGPDWQLTPSPFLIKDSSLYDYFDIGPQGIRMYASPLNKQMGIVECQVFPSEYEAFRQLMGQLPPDSMLSLYLAKRHRPLTELTDTLWKVKHTGFYYGQHVGMPLLGLRVALDPGHVALDMQEAELEGKYVKMRPSPQTHNQAIAFNEANLTLATAHLLREELEKMGAEVLLSRTEPGKGAAGLSYREWKATALESTLAEEMAAGRMSETDANWWRSQAREVDLYRRLFTPWDLRKRAEKINAFRPHLTLIIHYNIHSPNWEKRDAQGFFTPTGANYCMAFVPGSFLRGELETAENRMVFLRLLLTDHIEQSIALTSYFIKSSTRLTGVPIVSRQHQLSYLHNACIPTRIRGVYARNLTLTHLISGPLCYGESLCQDNIVEARALNDKDFDIAGMPAPSRIQDVARAYLRAVIRFARDISLPTAPAPENAYLR